MASQVKVTLVLVAFIALSAGGNALAQPVMPDFVVEEYASVPDPGGLSFDRWGTCMWGIRSHRG